MAFVVCIYVDDWKWEFQIIFTAILIAIFSIKNINQ